MDKWVATIEENDEKRRKEFERQGAAVKIGETDLDFFCSEVFLGVFFEVFLKNFFESFSGSCQRCFRMP